MYNFSKWCRYEQSAWKKYRKKDGTIVLLAVATLAKWHGYERVIKGLYNYYADGGERNIIFNIVGNGEQNPILQRNR